VSLQNRISRLERTFGQIGTVPAWAFQGALMERNRLLADYRLRTRMVEGRNRVAVLNGRDPEPLPERPAFDELDIEARRIFDKYGSQVEYEATLPGPLSIAGTLREARERGEVTWPTLNAD